MNLTQDLCKLVTDKHLWLSCSGQYSQDLLPEELDAVKRKGWLNMLKYDKQSVSVAIEKEDLELLDWITANKKFVRQYNFWEGMKWVVIGKGSLETFKWMWNRFSKRLDELHTIQGIGAFGRIDLAEWLYDNVTHFFPNEMYIAAASGNQIHLLKWAFTKVDLYYLPITQVACEAARTSRIEILEWLWEKHGSFHWSVLDTATRMKQQEAVKWIKGKGAVEKDERLCLSWDNEEDV